MNLLRKNMLQKRERKQLVQLHISEFENEE